jgi:hypothetical protein
VTIDSPVVGKPPRLTRPSWPRRGVAVLVFGVIGFAVSYGAVREDARDGPPPAPMPGSLCTLLRDEVVEDLVPQAAVETDSVSQGDTASSGRCLLATDEHLMDTMAKAEIEIEVERFGSQHWQSADDVHDRWRDRGSDDDELRDLDGPGDRAFAREYSYSEWYRHAEIGVVVGDTAVLVRYAASPADRDVVLRAAEHLTEEVVAAL